MPKEGVEEVSTMKFSQSSAVFFNYSLRHAIAELGGMGYDGIEIWGGRPHMYRHDLDVEMETLRSLLDANGLEVCNIIAAQYRYPSLLCSENEIVRKDSVEYIKSAIENAKKIGAPTVHLCGGMAAWDEDLEKGRRCLKKSFEELGEYVENEEGLNLLIEPAHRFESNLILTIDDGLRMIDELGSDRFGILLDTGHCHLNGEDLESAVLKCRGVPLHIHIDDNNGDFDSHLIPGRGTIDFGSLQSALSEIGYDGYVSAELGGMYITDPVSACEETLEYLQRIFPASNEDLEPFRSVRQ
ncbi:MAG: sugar phosphate isomerase/epimerase [Spirochaetes bacterium]|nr:sugar phosphate isomerase/epimerase [Spirochaetota bacterium]